MIPAPLATLHEGTPGTLHEMSSVLSGSSSSCLLFDRRLKTFQVTEFVDMTSAEKNTKTVILGESFGAMLGIRLGQLR